MALPEPFLKKLAEANEDPQVLLAKPALYPPKELDAGHGLSSYYISTSHNTYLSEHQLYGSSTTDTYTHVLKNAGRCVEIDAWDGPNNEPCVYHGWTLTKPVPVRDVITAIGEGITSPQDLPIIVSLENHCSPEQQDVMASMFRDILGANLVMERVGGGISPEDLTLKDVLGKILIKIEHFEALGPDQLREPVPAVDLSDSEDEDIAKSKDKKKKNSPDGDVEKAVKAKKKVTKQKITPKLAELGVYCQSVKPPKGTWWMDDILEPLQRVVNISESALLKILPHSTASILSHTTSHLMRVYPHGLRISSFNLNPLPFWRAGSQIVALNWQRFDLGMELNTALFADTRGWVLKPQHLRSGQRTGKDPRSGKRRMEVRVFGAVGLPDVEDVPPEKKMQAYVKADIVSSHGKKRHRTKDYKSKGGDDKGRNPVWDEVGVYEWQDEELVFLRIRIIHEDGWTSKDDPVAFYCALVDRLRQGWQFVGLKSIDGLDLESKMLLHVKIE